MTPKQTVQKAFDASVTPALASEGFSYLPSQFSYKRKRKSFIQRISVSLSHVNTQASIQFWTAFNIAAPGYNRWLKARGRDAGADFVGGCADWDIPGWSQAGDYSTGFDFSDSTSRTTVLSDWLTKCFRAGIPFLERLSTWQGLAEDLIRRRWHFDRAADFFLIAGQTDRAIEALAAGIDTLERQDFSWSPMADPVLIAKKKRQAKERGSAVRVLRQRIENLNNSEPIRGANA